MSAIIMRPSSLIEVDDEGDVYGSSDGAASFDYLSDAQILTYVADASDLTCVRTRYKNARIIRYKLPTPSVPAGEFPVRLSSLVRWSHGYSGKFVGASVYRAGSNPPSSTAVLAVTGATVPTTSEPMQVALDGAAALSGWAVQAWMAGDRDDAGRPVVWETGATLYTLARSTAVPRATTMTSSTLPEIVVDVTAAIGWEAAAASWSGLRTVTVELLVTLGGLPVVSAQQDVLFTSSGTQAVTIAIPRSLANGAYLVSARAIRHREQESGVAADQIGAWSTAVSLAMMVPRPLVPTLVVSPNPDQSSVTITISSTASAGYLSPYVSLERSDDGMVSWAPVRGGSLLAAAAWAPVDVTDWEASPGQLVWYRASVSAYYSGVLNVSDVSDPVPGTVPVTGWNLKLPQDPSRSVFGLVVLGAIEEGWVEDVGVFRPDERGQAITVSGAITPLDGTLTIWADAAMWAVLMPLLFSRAVLRLESPYGWSKWIKLVESGKVTTIGTATSPRRQISVTYVTTQRPVSVIPNIPLTLQLVVDAGAAVATVWDLVVDAGDASASAWDAALDCGSVN